MQIRTCRIGWVGTFVPDRGRYVRRFKDSDVSIPSAELFVSAKYRGTRGRCLIVMKIAGIRRKG